MGRILDLGRDVFDFVQYIYNMSQLLIVKGI